MEQEKPMVCTDKDFGRFYVALKLNLKTNRYECIYSHNQEVFEIARKTEDYDTFIQIYIERFIHDADKSKLRDFLLSDKLTENLVHGYAEQDIIYRRIESEKSYIKMRAKKYVDIKDNIAMIATVYKGNIIKNLIMDCQSYTKYRPNETTGGIFVSWRRKEELPTGA